MTEELPNKHYFRPDEVAEVLRISRSTVYDMIKKKKILAVKIGRLTRIPKDEYLKIVSRC